MTSHKNNTPRCLRISQYCVQIISMSVCHVDVDCAAEIPRYIGPAIVRCVETHSVWKPPVAIKFDMEDSGSAERPKEHSVKE